MSLPTESKIDVLIIGAGPAGLMMATWLARCGVGARIVDKRGTKIFNGQADGLQCRTLEIFDSLGFAHRAWRESNHLLEICLWNPDEHGRIRRSGRIPDTIPGISRFQQVVLHQGRIERFLLDAVEACSDIRVERGVAPTSIDIDESRVDDDDAHPVTVRLRRLSEEEATPEQAAGSADDDGAPVQDGLFRSNLTRDTDRLFRSNLSRDTDRLLTAAKAGTEEQVVHARYVVGADGAHSWTRRQVGLELEGDSTDHIWGVLDMVPITDFPDIRMRCAIHSADAGSIMVIPRENKLVRLYIQLTTTERVGGDEPARADRSKLSPRVILEAARRIMAPYTLSYRKLDWWTAYQIGQRVGTSFSVHDRVFLAGDAVHTHSPKAGQGMNVSMQDSFNLGWKMASVVKAQAHRCILKTYESERRQIAQDLIAFDHKFSRLFSGRPARDVMDTEGISMQEFKTAFEKGHMFASGIAVDYGSSVVVAKDDDGHGQSHTPATTRRVVSDQSAAPHVPVGRRIPSVKVLNQADARPWHLHELLPSNGRWRVLLFPGDVTTDEQRQRLARVAAAFDDEASFLRRHTPVGGRRCDDVFEILTIHRAPRTQVTIFDFPPVLRPYDETDGWSYDRIFVDDVSYHEGHGEIYRAFGIAPAGCVIIVRPDQHVSYVGPLDDTAAVNDFFARFMTDQSRRGSVDSKTPMPTNC